MRHFVVSGVMSTTPVCKMQTKQRRWSSMADKITISEQEIVLRCQWHIHQIVIAHLVLYKMKKETTPLQYHHVVVCYFLQTTYQQQSVNCHFLGLKKLLLEVKFLYALFLTSAARVLVYYRVHITSYSVEVYVKMGYMPAYKPQSNTYKI